MPDIRIETHIEEREIEVWIRNIEVFSFQELIDEIENITTDFEYSIVDVDDYPMDNPRSYFEEHIGNREDTGLWKFYEVAVAFDKLNTDDEEQALVCFLNELADQVVGSPFTHNELLEKFREHYEGSYDDSEDFAENYLCALYDLPKIVQHLINWERAADHLSQDFMYVYGDDGLMHIFRK